MIPVFTHGRTCSAEKSRLSLNLINWWKQNWLILRIILYDSEMHVELVTFK